MTAESITQSRLKELLQYNPDTGIFIWRVSKSSKTKVGNEAGNLSDGYIHIRIDYRMYRAHRLAFLYMTGEFPSDQTDHINHIRNDNRWGNLREASYSVNHKNQSMPRNNTSGYMGVYWHKYTGKWMAYINVDRKRVHLGMFVDKTDAIKTRKAAEIKYGFHDNHGVR